MQNQQTHMELDYQQAATLLFNAENPRLTYLSLFFSKEENINQILPLFSKKKKVVSKTLIEWTIIKLAKLIPLQYEWKGQWIDIADEYTLFRSQGTKEHSDPFARRPRATSKVSPDLAPDNIKFDFLYDYKTQDPTKSIETTEAQLTFLKWIIVRGILDFIRNNIERLNRLYLLHGVLKKHFSIVNVKLHQNSNKAGFLSSQKIVFSIAPHNLSKQTIKRKLNGIEMVHGKMIAPPIKIDWATGYWREISRKASEYNIEIKII